MPMYHHMLCCISNEDISEFLEYSRQPEVHESIYKRIAPKIFGTKGSSVDDIKKAIACLLFGGARKVGTVQCIADVARRSVCSQIIGRARQGGFRNVLAPVCDE